VLNAIAGVRDSAVVGVPIGSEERVHAVLVSIRAPTSTPSCAQANARSSDHQKIRRAVAWPEPSCRAPRARASSNGARFATG
jgi:hypothetical protein